MSYNLLSGISPNYDSMWTGTTGATWGRSSDSGSTTTYPDGTYTGGTRCASVWSPTAGTGEAYAQLQGQTPHLIPTHTYYFRVWIRRSGSAAGTVDIYWPITEPPIISGAALPSSASVWEKYSAIFTRSTFTEGDYPIRIDWNAPGTGTSSIQLNFAGFVLVDLTDLYGAGNEPSDKTYLDQNITYNVDKYFCTSAELVAVANAIRIKKNQTTTYQSNYIATYDKTFPTEFVTDIASI